jgi:DNA-binding transcriptional ArsR family regulator
MALISQWINQRPWLAAGIAGATGGFAGLAGGVFGGVGFSRGVIDTTIRELEHPVRRRILNTLDAKPGLCYRELQSTLSTANGTLRHHLDVLQSRRSITIYSINGRTCYFAGAPSQVEVLKGMNVNEEEAAVRMPIGLSLVQRLIIEDIKVNGIPRSQAALARRIGRTRATVHSALKVLRRRGILREDKIEFAPHLIDESVWNSSRTIDYDWSDDRR